MATIDTTATTSGLYYCNGRHIDRTSTGRLWVGFNNGAGSLEFWYSDNNGTSWTQNASASIASPGEAPGWSFFIDIDDHAHVVYQTGENLTYRRMASISTGTSWATAFTVNATYDQQPDIVAFRDGSSWRAAIAASNGSSTEVYILSAVDTTPTISQTLSFFNCQYPSMSFHHTGDAKTTAGSTPHLYVAGIDGINLRYQKFTYSGGTYSTGTQRLLRGTATKSSAVSLAFDGTRVVVGYAESNVVGIAERDEADTATTLRTPVALADGNLTNVSVSYDSLNDIHLWASGATSDDLKRCVYDRSAGTWSSWTTVQTGTIAVNSVTLKRGYSNALIEAVFLDGLNVSHASLQLNQAPTAPTWQAPADNSANDVAATLPLDWQFNDPDSGDSQKSYVLERSVNGAAVEFYNAGAGTWGASLTINASTTSSVTLAAAWAADGDSVVYRVKTYDALDTEGVFSATRTITGSTKFNPTLTAPADLGTITTSQVTATWTVAEQTSYQLRLLSATDTQISTTGKVLSTVKSVTLPKTLTDGTTYKVEVTTWNNDDLESNTDTHTFTVDFVEPAAPTYVVAAEPDNGLTSVTITDPTPTGGQPTVTSHDVYVRVKSASGARPAGEIPVGGDGIRIKVDETSGVYRYRAAPGVDLEFRTNAKANNGTSVFGAWT